MTEYDADTRARPVSGWAIGGTVFAGVIMLLVGLFHAVAGLVALIDDEFYVVTRNYTFELDVTGWGWIHLIAGIVVALGGVAVFSGATWARVIGIALACVSAIANFFFLPYYPFWSIVMIALAVWVIWSLSRSLEARA
ncbi:MAG TPA: hypothetical protein VD704_06380 [Gaiellaceae bacterium]|nr:hypothetical protein [Gaiellaceae bacterium]